MPTIRDIQLELEKEGIFVSAGTISNALSGKGNVGTEKLTRILAMADKLGYKSSSNVLRTSSTKIIACLLPTLENPLYQSFYQTLEQKARLLGYSVLLYLTKDSESLERSTLNTLSTMKQDALILFSSALDSELLRKFTCPIFFVERKVHMAGAFHVHFDYYGAGFDIGKTLTESGSSRVQLVTGPQRHSCNSEFLKGLAAGIGREAAPGIVCQHAAIPLYDSFKELFHLMLQLPANAPDTIVCASPYYREILKSLFALSGFGGDVRMLAVTPAAVVTGGDCFPLSYSYAASWIMGKIQRQSTRSETLQIPYKSEARYRNSAQKTRAVDKAPLKILATTDASAHQLKLLSPIIRGQLGMEVEIHLYDYDRFQALAQADEPPEFDIVRMDVSALPYHAPRLLRPMEDFSRERFIEEIPNDYFMAGELPYSYPFNPTMMLLLYRGDVFEDPMIKRRFYEEFRGMQLLPPTSYAECNLVAKFLTKSFHPNRSGHTLVNYGCAACKNGPITVANQYQSRLLSMKGGYFDQNRLCLDDETALEALTLLQESLQYAPDAGDASDAEVFARGDVAFANTFSSYVAALSFWQDAPAFANMRFAPAPTSLRGGGVLGIGRHSKRPRQALELIQFLTGDALAPALTKLGIYAPVKSLYLDSAIQSDHPILYALKYYFCHSIGRDIAHPETGRPLDTASFERILGEEISAVLQGRKEAAPALREAQRRLSALLNPSDAGV